MPRGGYVPFDSRPFLYTIIVEPVGDLVTLEQIKQQLNIPVSNTTDDALLTLYSKSVTQYIENFTRRDYFVRTYETFRDYFGNGFISFPSIFPEYYTENNFLIERSPVLVVTKVEYLIDGVFTLLDDTIYYVTFDQARYAKILLRPDQVYPTDKDRIQQSIKITFTAGLDPIPFNIQVAALNIITALYADRGDCSCDNSVGHYVTGAARALLLQERILKL